MEARTIEARSWGGWKVFSIYACLLILLCSVSFGGVLFSLMDVNGVFVAPFLKSSWRMCGTSIIQLLPFLYEVKKAPKQVMMQYLTWSTFGLLSATGFFLGVHFASWVWSIQLTSLAHSLLWVSCSPIVIVLFLWVVKVLSYWPFCKEKVIPRIDTYPTALETVGTLIGFAGGAIICLDAQSDASVSLLGNLYAFIGAVAMCFYLGTGQVLRKWMPTFMYALPVNVIAFVFLVIASLIFEGSSFQGPPNSNIFGCFMDTRYFLLTCGLAVIPGLLGHTMINFILKHVSALVVSIVLLFEPLVGSIFGYLFNVQLVPGIYTLVGGPILLVGAGMVVIGGSVSPQKKPPVEEKATSEQEITVEI